MLVVMIGFAMSFHVLFRDFDSFGETFLDLFKSMLGDTAFFEVFAGLPYDGMATALLVIYLFIVAIMLLNLLVAILSTSHAKVEDNVEREFKVSKARIIEHYQLVVKDNLLPAPFNLIDELLRLGPTRSATFFNWLRGLVGRLLFFLVLSPMALAGGMLLWVFSCILAPFKWCRHYSKICKEYNQDAQRDYDNNPSMSVCTRVVTCVIIVLVSVCAAFSLCFVWIYGFFQVLFSWIDQGGQADANVDDSIAESLVEALLKKRVHGGVGVDDLRRFLDDPMDDSRVRKDEKTRSVTVEHIKLLRNRLENTLASSSKFEELRKVSVTTKEWLQQLDARLKVLETRSEGLQTG